jgi:hypothetical protein
MQVRCPKCKLQRKKRRVEEGGNSHLGGKMKNGSGRSNNSRQTKGVDAGNPEMSSGEARNRGHDGWNLDQMRAFRVQNGSSCFAHQTPRLRSPDQCPTQLTLLLRDIKKRPSPQASALQGVNEANLRRPRNTAKGTGATRAEQSQSRLQQCKNQGRQLWLAWRGRGFEALGREAADSVRTDGHAALLCCPRMRELGGSGRAVLSTD